MNSMALASVISPPFLATNSMKNGFRLVWISSMKLIHLLHGIWEIFYWFPSVLTHIIPMPVNKILELTIKYSWIQNVLHFIFLTFTINFNRWRGIMDSSWSGRRMVRFQQGNMKRKMDFHRTWKLELESHNIDLFHNEEWT